MFVFWYGLKVQFWTADHSNLNDERYLQMINKETDPHLHEHFVEQQHGALRRLWWKQDGAPAHRRIIRERLRELVNHMVIALTYDPEWPPRPPDPTQMWFFFFGGISSV